MDLAEQRNDPEREWDRIKDLRLKAKMAYVEAVRLHKIRVSQAREELRAEGVHKDLLLDRVTLLATIPDHPIRAAEVAMDKALAAYETMQATAETLKQVVWRINR